MQPYEHDPQDEADWEAVYEASLYDAELQRQNWTDDDIRAMGYKESMKYPGYFHSDPRYPALTVEDRYLMDHPGPHWTQKEKLPRRFPSKTSRYDDEMFAGRAVIDLEEEEKISQQRSDIIANPPRWSSYGKASEDGRKTGLWICQVCHRDFALWPSERAWRKNLLGLLFQVVIRSPYACTNCRVMRFKTQQQIGHQNHRPFWTRVINFWETKHKHQWILRRVYRRFGL